MMYMYTVSKSVYTHFFSILYKFNSFDAEYLP